MWAETMIIELCNDYTDEQICNLFTKKELASILKDCYGNGYSSHRIHIPATITCTKSRLVNAIRNYCSAVGWRELHSKHRL